jgi:hypothetical protein
MTLRSGSDSPTLGSAHAPLPQTPLILVTGKGGVGRSSTATAIAVALTQLGRRVALVHPVDAPAVPPPTDAPADLVVIGLDRDQALSHYLGDQLPGPFAAALRASRAFKLITAATPGLAELLTIGELRRLADQYDHVVFDAPATGHLLAMLDAPGRFERAAAVGPVARRASDLGRWITDPAVCATVAVTTGDSLAVSEMLDLLRALETRMTHGPALVVANRLAPVSPTAAELEQLSGRGRAGNAALLVAALEKLAGRARSERAQLGRVTRQLGSPPVRAQERPGDALGALTTALHDEPVPHDEPHEDEPADEPQLTAVERRRMERRQADRRADAARRGNR